MSQDTKDKISKTKKSMPNKGFNGRKHSKKSNEKNRISHIGKKHSEETKIKIRNSSLKGKNSRSWKGGIYIDRYIHIYEPSHPFAHHNGYVYQHRIIIEKIIGRFLNPIEVIHHIDEIKTNNSLNNLIAFTSKSAHIRFHSNPNNVKPEEIIFDGRNHTKFICFHS